MNDELIVPTSIPLVDLKAQRATIAEDLERAIARVIGRCDFILGEELALFEREFAKYCGVPYALGVANGTDALHLACRALISARAMKSLCPL